MKIETKFSVGEIITTIEHDSIKQFPITEIQIYVTGKIKIRYVLLKSKAINFGDNDSVVTKDEDECFKSLRELYEYYQQKDRK